LRIGAVGAARTSPDYFPLVVLNTVLGGTFTSRLNLRLREQSGYTYGAFSHFSFRRGAGPFVAGAAVQTEVTDRAIAESFEEMARLRREPVEAEELRRAKQYLTLGLARAFETNGSVASRLAELELYGLGADYWSQYSGWISGVSADAVMDAAQHYLDPERMRVAVVGDAAKVRSSIESLGIGPVRDERAAV
jgi:zinc protease